MLLSWCGVSALSAAAVVVFAAVRPRHVALRAVWTVLLVPGEMLPFALLPIAWTHTRFVIPFLGPPVRIGMVPVWWALAAVALSFVAAGVDVARSRGRWWLFLLPPMHAAAVIRRLWRHGS